MRRKIVLFLSVLAFFCLAVPCTGVRAEDVPAPEGEQTEVLDGTMTYSEYIEFHGGVAPGPDTVIALHAADYAWEQDSGAYITGYAGRDSVLRWDDPMGSVTWRFDVEEPGWYQLALTYCGLPAKGSDIILDVALDGETPFENCRNLNLRRIFADETYFGMDDNDFDVNLRGDELRPALIEQAQWQTKYLTDVKDQYPGALHFWLDTGEHTVTLSLREEAVAIALLCFSNEVTPAPYADALADWDASGAVDTSGFLGEFEAEKSFLKNGLTLFPTYDTANVHVTPSNPSAVLYNTIGKNTWKEIGQEITWEFEVPEDGYYYLAFKVKQYDKTNAYSERAVTLDGKALCADMALQKFSFDTNWYVQCLESAAGEPLKVSLTAGRHVLGMSATMDEDLASVLRDIEETTAQLQGWYREIIRVTGFNADADRMSIDTNRDFNLEKTVPGLLEGLKSCREMLVDCYERIDAMEGISASCVSGLRQTAQLLERMIKHPRKIAGWIETFRGNISSIAGLPAELRAQPLTMDKFYVFSPDVSVPEVGGGLLEQVWYRFRMFLHSFTDSANTVAGATETGESDVTLKVWVSTADITTTGASSGRDQAIILKKLIDESFTTKYGVNVDVSLVSGSDTLVQAVLAGEGPDVALFTSVDTPVNLAMRGLLLELSQFEGFDETIKEFTPSALTPFRYKNGVYALPETQNFNMIFYRTDVYSELGLTPPKTWDEFYEQIVELSNANYMVGVPQNQNTFETFLYQAGSTFYTEDLSRSTFDTQIALDSFERWTDLYTKYSLSLIFDFFNRFRSGELAMGIMPYNQVNYLSSAAPELDGLWDMAPIPGTVMADGTINNVETSTSTGCIALGDTRHPQEAYDFLSWWVSSETQAAFGVQLEQTLGIAARYATANIVAFDSIPWTRDQAKALTAQRESTVALDQIPGSYYIARNLSFAFRAVVYNHANIRETLYRYNIEINKELERKQREFSY